MNTDLHRLESIAELIEETAECLLRRINKLKEAILALRSEQKGLTSDECCTDVAD